MADSVTPDSADTLAQPHRRLNPLTNEYILVSPHRSRRPWLGQVEPKEVSSLPTYDPACYLCPNNTRANGEPNPPFEAPFTFGNDFAAVLPFDEKKSVPSFSPHPLLAVEPIYGHCDVLVFHPRHDLTLARLEVTEIQRIIAEWIAIYLKRSNDPDVQYVQIFENKGSMMGCSNPHPHGQVWSLSVVPSLPAKELTSLRHYSASHMPNLASPKGYMNRPCLLCDYAHFEIYNTEHSRIVVKNTHWVALVPWWATWPFEILLLPYRRHIPSLVHQSSEEQLSLAEILSQVTTRYDNLFSCSFAYSMGVHQRPTMLSAEAKEDEDDIAHLHLHFYPPLLRSASVRKFMVGFELFAESQRDLTPEVAAQRLRDCSEIHYLSNDYMSK